MSRLIKMVAAVAISTNAQAEIAKPTQEDIYASATCLYAAVAMEDKSAMARFTAMTANGHAVYQGLPTGESGVTGNSLAFLVMFAPKMLARASLDVERMNTVQLVETYDNCKGALGEAK